jgi:hypothetical protein
MNAHIDEGELKLLAFLHEHAEGYTEHFALDPADVEKELDVSIDRLKKDASYLAGHGLAGITTLDTSTYGSGRSALLVGLWLTSAGEDYVRALERDEKVGRRLTAKVVAELWGMGKGILASVAAAVLGDFLRGRHPH